MQVMGMIKRIGTPLSRAYSQVIAVPSSCLSPEHTSLGILMPGRGDDVRRCKEPFSAAGGFRKAPGMTYDVVEHRKLVHLVA